MRKKKKKSEARKRADAIFSRISMAKRREKDRAGVQAYQKDWYAKNKDRLGEERRARYAASDVRKKKARAKARNRKARVRLAPGTHTAQDIAEIHLQQRGMCAFTGMKIRWCLGKFSESNTPHVDHIIPLIRGGTNDRRNLQLLCEPCNLRKGSKDPLEHAKRMGLLC